MHVVSITLVQNIRQAKIAEGVRDRLHREAKQIEAETRRREIERQRLIRHGVDCAHRELGDAEGLDFVERMRIETRIKRELETLEGDESDADIEDMVADLIEEEGVLWDEGGE